MQIIYPEANVFDSYNLVNVEPEARNHEIYLIRAPCVKPST